MGAGAAILPALSIGMKLFGGGGGAQPAAAGGGGTPFDGVMNPNAVPQRNPMFSGGIDQGPPPGQPAGAQMIPNKPPMPAPGARAQIPQPERNPIFSGGTLPDAPDMQQYVPGELSMNPELDQPGQTVFKQASKGYDPYAAARNAGYTTDTVYANEVNRGDGPPPKTRPAKSADEQGLFGDTGATEEDTTAPVQATTSRAKPAPAPKSLANPKTPDEDDDSEDSDTTVGNGFVRKLFGGEAGDFVGTLNDKLGDTATNPLFQVGMGLMSSGYSGADPYANIQKSLSAVPGHQIAAQSADLALNADKRAQQKTDKEVQDAEQQRQLAALLAAIGQKYGQQPGMAPGSAIARGGAKVIK